MRSRPMGLSWTTFAVLGGFCLALLLVVILAVPGYFGMLGAETGSRPGRLPAPCDTVVGRHELVESLHDVPSGITIDMPAGRWNAVPESPSERAPGRSWRDPGSRDVVRTEVLDHFPGRPRIDREMHGIGELERCRVAWGSDSAWIATGFAMNNPDYRVAIAILPLEGGRWLRAAAYTAGEMDRQRALLAAVRTVRVDQR